MPKRRPLVEKTERIAEHLNGFWIGIGGEPGPAIHEWDTFPVVPEGGMSGGKMLD